MIRPKPNPHKSHARTSAKRSAATTKLFQRAAEAYKTARQIERFNPKKAAALYRQASEFLARANKSGGIEGPVGRLPNGWFSREKITRRISADDPKGAVGNVGRARAFLEMARIALSDARDIARKNPDLTDDDPDWYDIEEEGMRLGKQAARAIGRSEREHRAQVKFFKVSYFSPLRGKRVEFIRPIEAHTITDAKKQAKAMVTNDPKASNFVAKEARRNPKIKTSYLTLATTPRKSNFGLIDLATNLQAADYVSRLAGGRKHKNPVIKAHQTTFSALKVGEKFTLGAKTVYEKINSEQARFGGGRSGRHWKIFTFVPKDLVDRIIKKNPTFVSAQSHEFAIKKLEKERRQLKKDIREGFENTGTQRRLSQINSEILALRRFIRQRRNPTPDEMSERFQGRATGKVQEYYFSDSAPNLDQSRCGKFIFLKREKGKQITAPGAVVAIDPKTEKLWIGSKYKRPMFTRKAARKGEGLDFGPVDVICYETAKAHIGKGKTFEYVHPFGEEGGRKPHLIIDHEGMPVLRGGDYKIKSEGIVN